MGRGLGRGRGGLAQGRRGLNRGAAADEVPGMRCVRMLCLLATLSACEGASGNDPAAHGKTSWSAVDGSFSLDYLSPPWEVVTQEEQRLELEIPPEVFGVALDGTPPTHIFRIGGVEQPAELDDLVGDAELVEGELPDHLKGLDLTSVGAVALAELDHLLDEQDAQLDRELETFVTDAGQEALVYQVIVAPGLFVRAFYLPARPTVCRAMFVSLFELRTADVDAMARTIETAR